MAFRLAQVFEHPLKSGRGNEAAQAEVRPEGLARDRRFLAHTLDGTFVSGRSHPHLVRVTVDFDGTRAVFRSPGRPDLTVVPDETTLRQVAVWARRFEAWDQGDEAAAWFSEALGDELRLAWLGQSRRPLLWDSERRTTFADAAPLLALGTASVAEISRRAGEGFDLRRFRPNLVIEGSGPFEEDGWKRIRVGPVEFRLLDGCSRCEFTTIDPDTGARHPGNEPVATLETFRRTDTGLYVGMNLMPLTTGRVSVGDAVTVLETRRPLRFTVVPGAGTAPPAPAPEAGAWPAALVCTGVRDEAPGVKTFTWRRQDGRAASWRAGQYLTLRLDRPEGPLRRSYSISSAPGTLGAGVLELSVKRQEGGVGSTFLHDRVGPGSQVVAEVLAGSFTLDDHPWQSYLLIGAGAGVTPLIALLRDAAARDRDVGLAFLQVARSPDDLLFQADLADLQRRLGPRLEVATRLTGLEGHLDQVSLARFCPDLRDRRVLVCGPPGFRTSVRGLLAASGLKLDRRYHEEVFGEEALPEPAEARPGTVTFRRSGRTALSDGRSTFLQVAERAGIDLPASCRSGDCGTCRVLTGRGTWVLACQTFPEGDESLEV